MTSQSSSEANEFDVFTDFGIGAPEADLLRSDKAKAVQVLRSVQGNDDTADLSRHWALYASTQG